jgi:hypothetical protein
LAISPASGIQDKPVIRFIVILIGLAIFASGATFGRYGNFDPCDWTAQDQAEATLIPKIVWEGRLKAKFLVKGIAEPTYTDCMLAWWESRAEEAVERTADKTMEKIRN